MRSRSRALVGIVCGAVLALSLTSCTTYEAPHPSPSPLPRSFATFSGSESGRVYLSLCGGKEDSIIVILAGTHTRLTGVVSSVDMNFNGKDSVYSIEKTGTLPRFSTDRKHVQLDGVTLASVLDPSRTVTFAGSLACP